LRRVFLAMLCGYLALVSAAYAQQVDAAFGVGTLTAPSSNNAVNFANFRQSLSGGTYLSFSGDALIKHDLGIGTEISWRASRSFFGSFQPYRPVFWDINGIYAPRFSKHMGAEMSAGLGAESIRFYQNFAICDFFSGCTNYVTSTHFMGHFGGGLRFYPLGNFFIRPEVHLYLINNNVEFSSNYAVRYGGSIGYTFGGR
jgi:hypothetical protein